MSETWIEWSPQWAQHVKGAYTKRVVEDPPEPQKVRMHCTVCDARWQTLCASGNVRRHIATFAKQHTHKVALDEAPKIVRPGSKRSSIVER